MTTTAFLRVPVLLPALSARSFVFFRRGVVEACARCACLLSNEMQRERERKEVFRLGKYDRQKREIVRKREKNFYFRARRKGEQLFWTFVGPNLLLRDESLFALSRGRFPFAFDYCCNHSFV